MEKCLEAITLKKKLKFEEQEKLRRRIDKLEGLRRSEEVRKEKEAEVERLKEEEENIMLEIQL
jgi:excinuclease UvrABC nuclease subunit